MIWGTLNTLHFFASLSRGVIEVPEADGKGFHASPVLVEEPILGYLEMRGFTFAKGKSGAPDKSIGRAQCADRFSPVARKQQSICI